MIVRGSHRSRLGFATAAHPARRSRPGLDAAAERPSAQLTSFSCSGVVAGPATRIQPGTTPVRLVPSRHLTDDVE